MRDDIEVTVSDDLAALKTTTEARLAFASPVDVHAHLARVQARRSWPHRWVTGGLVPVVAALVCLVPVGKRSLFAMAVAGVRLLVDAEEEPGVVQTQLQSPLDQQPAGFGDRPVEVRMLKDGEWRTISLDEGLALKGEVAEYLKGLLEEDEELSQLEIERAVAGWLAARRADAARGDHCEQRLKVLAAEDERRPVRVERRGDLVSVDLDLPAADVACVPVPHRLRHSYDASQPN